MGVVGVGFCVGECEICIFCVGCVSVCFFLVVRGVVGDVLDGCMVVGLGGCCVLL